MTDIGTVVGPRHVAGSSVGHWVARYRLDTSDGSNVKTFTRVNSHSVSKYSGPDSPLLHIVSVIQPLVVGAEFITSAPSRNLEILTIFNNLKHFFLLFTSGRGEQMTRRQSW